MNNTWIIIALFLIGGGIAYAKITKTDAGLTFTSDKVQTWYENRIIWGDNYVDHKGQAPVHNTEVIAFGDGWSFSTTTDDDGSFKVEVKPDVPFKIKASDGNQWSTSEELSPVPLGTTKVDKS